MKAKKQQNWNEGTAALKNLVAWNYEVHPFSDIHFRINRRLDVWPSTKKWYDIKTHVKGEYVELESFIKAQLPI